MISIDDNEVKNLKFVLNRIFGEKNFVANLVWKSKSGGAGDSRLIAIDTEFILLHGKNKKKLGFNKKKLIHNGKFSDENVKKYGKFTIRRLNETGIRYSQSLDFGVELPKDNKFYLRCNPPKTKIILFPNKDNLKHYNWRWNKTKIEIGFKKNYLIITKNKDGKYQLNQKIYEFFDTSKEEKIKYRESVYRNLIIEFNTTLGTKEIKKIFKDKDYFRYPKPYQLIQHLLKIGTDKKDTVLDFFAGSGTTGHAVLKQNKEDEGNRKFILVEHDKYFDTVTKPRILKVIYSDNWKEGKPLDNNGSKKQIIKYQTLEQYEDSLTNIDFKEPKTLLTESKDYRIKYMLEFESKKNNVFLNIEALNNPFKYKLKIEEKNKIKQRNIDLVETFNYIAGIHVTSIKQYLDDKRKYVVVEGIRDNKETIVIWRDKTNDFDPKQDKEFITKEILRNEYDDILVNGNSLVKNAKSIDNLFKMNMFL